MVNIVENQYSICALSTIHYEYQGNIYSKYSSNSEVNGSELLNNPEETLHQ